jgi:hypothetical protein
MFRKSLAMIAILGVLVSWGCMESMVEPEAKTDTGEAMGLPPYNGPKARVAVADFEWKVDGSGSSTKMSVGGQTIEISHSEQSKPALSCLGTSEHQFP